jgi:hypothetical protein
MRGFVGTPAQVAGRSNAACTAKRRGAAGSLRPKRAALNVQARTGVLPTSESALLLAMRQNTKEPAERTTPRWRHRRGRNATVSSPSSVMPNARNASGSGAFSRARNERFRNHDIFRHVFERIVGACIAAGLVGGEGLAVDASLMQADANMLRSIPGTE